MDIVNFFKRAEGTWFSQRTTHFIQGQPSQTGQATLEITALTADASAVTTLCQTCGTDPSSVLLALQIQPEGRLDGSPPVPQNSVTTFVVMKSADMTGRFLSQTGTEDPVQGEYQLTAAVLTLVTDSEQLHSEERIWYLNPNLRMRTSFSTLKDGFQLASFCSEIRRGVTRAASG